MFRVLKFFFWFWDRRRKSSSEERCKSSPLFNTHTQHIYIMFAATQQIASVAGLKATKVQVRRHNARRLFCFLTSSSSFFGFVASARDLDGSASRAMMSGDFCVSIIQTKIPKRVVPRGKAIAETIWISKEEEREEKRVSETLDVPSIKRGARSISSIENAMMERYVFETRIKKKRSLDTNKKNPILFYTTNIFLPKKERDTDQNKLLLLFFHQQTVQVRLQGCQG